MATRAYRMGNFVTDTPGDLVVGSISNTAANRYSTILVAGAGYQVPASKTFYCIAIIVGQGTAGNRGYFGYGDTSVTDSASAPTNSVQQSANMFSTTSTTASSTYQIFFAVPTGKYPFFFSNDGAQIATIWGAVV